MVAEAPQTRKALAAMLRELGVDRELWEDFEQEALLDCWRREVGRPGQSPRYYLNGCRYFLRNLMRAGRSVDSPRHGAGRCVGLNGEQALERVPGGGATESPVLAEVAVRELVAALRRRSTPLEAKVLGCLVDGSSLRESAKSLQISHTAVLHARRRIAQLAVRLGYRVQRPSCRRFSRRRG